MKNWKTLLLGIAMVANTSFAAPQVVDKVAAVVNNGVVLESDVDGLMQSVKLNALAIAELESGDDHSAQAVHTTVSQSLEKAIGAGELSPRCQGPG